MSAIGHWVQQLHAHPMQLARIVEKPRDKNILNRIELDVLKVISDHHAGITANQIGEVLDIDRQYLRSSIENLQRLGRIVSNSKYRNCNVWRIS